MTDKKIADISKHRSSPTNSSVGGTPLLPDSLAMHSAAPSTAPTAVSFDIIPADKVTPSATARPVITSSQPVQTDNTLTGDETGGETAVLKTSRGSFMTESPKASGVSEELLAEKSVKLSQSEEEVADRQDGAATEVDKPTATGPTVSELLAGKPKTLGEKTIAPPVHEPTSDEEPSPEKPASAGVSSNPAADNPPSMPLTPETEPAEPDLASDDNSKDAAKDKDGLPDFKPLSESESTVLEEPQLYGGKSVLVIHEPQPLRDTLRALSWAFVVLLLLLAVGNFLLDAGIISVGSGIPHTDFISTQGQ